MLPPLDGYLAQLAATLAIELLLAFLLAPPSRRGGVVLTTWHANLLTHPPATLAVLYGAALPFAAIELVVFAVEALLLVRVAVLPVWRGLLIAFVANAASAAAGLWIQA